MLRIDQDLYVLDYGAGHEVGIENELKRIEVIGCADFDHREDGRKLIDLRGRDLLRDDYAQKLDAAGFHRAPRGRAPRWLDLVTCKAPGKSANCACPRTAPTLESK
jgi:hypothetical protein